MTSQSKMDPSARHCLETLALFQGRLGIEYEHIKNLGIGFCIWQSYHCPKFQKWTDFAHILCEKSTHQKNCSLLKITWKTTNKQFSSNFLCKSGVTKQICQMATKCEHWVLYSLVTTKPYVLTSDYKELLSFDKFFWKTC